VPGGETSSEADWEPSMCTFSGGEAHFMASGINSCGMHNLADPQEYGAWFARLQGTGESPGELFSDIFLLWPDNNQWPPEIDVYEDEGEHGPAVAEPGRQRRRVVAAGHDERGLGRAVQLERLSLSHGTAAGRLGETSPRRRTQSPG
jgi:hypothetical protein